MPWPVMKTRRLRRAVIATSATLIVRAGCWGEFGSCCPNYRTGGFGADYFRPTCATDNGLLGAPPGYGLAERRPIIVAATKQITRPVLNICIAFPYLQPI